MRGARGYRRNERSPFRALTHHANDGECEVADDVEMKEARLGR